MRLWSIHPQYLDSKGLVALWRESLLAQAVLYDKTVGYRKHSELVRFKQHESPKGIIYEYLQSIFDESLRREYQFDRTRVFENPHTLELPRIPVTRERIEFEWEHLSLKLQQRNVVVYHKNLELVSKDEKGVQRDIVCNPIFEIEH